MNLIKKENIQITSVNNDVKTSTTIFMLPALGINKDILLSNKFINAYYSDDEHNIIYDDSIYLLFHEVDNDKFEELIKDIESRHKINEVYDIEGGYTIIVVKFPTQFINEFKYFKEGSYSKFSQLYIDSFFPFKKPIAWDSKGRVIKEEYTLFYHIFNRTDWLKDWWAKRLGYEDMKDFELEEWWDKPYDKKEIFRYKLNNNE